MPSSSCGRIRRSQTISKASIRANADKLYATRRPAPRAAAPVKEGEAAPAAEPVVKAPARSSESELDIMVED